MTAGRLVNRRALVLAAFVAVIGATVLATFVSRHAAPTAARAADHLDAPGLTPPPGGDGIGTDLTDIYAFRSPSSPSKSVLIMDVNGLTTADLANPPGPDRPFGTKVPQVGGNPNVTYHFRVDANGDAKADTDIVVTFGKAQRDGSQAMTVKIRPRHGHGVTVTGHSTGFGKSAIVNNGPMGIKAFAGRRDDPFFFNLLGFLNILDLGGQSFVGCGSPTSHPETDTFKGQNVSAIVLELPSSLLEAGGDSKIGVWATTDVGSHQIDRMGRPAINTVFIPNNPFPPDRVADGKPSSKTTFNHGTPATDVAKMERRGRRHAEVPLQPERPRDGSRWHRRPVRRCREDHLARERPPARRPHGRRVQPGRFPERPEAVGRRHRRRAQPRHRGLRDDRLRRLERRVSAEHVPVPRGSAPRGAVGRANVGLEGAAAAAPSGCREPAPGPQPSFARTSSLTTRGFAFPCVSFITWPTKKPRRPSFPLR